MEVTVWGTSGNVVQFVGQDRYNIIASHRPRILYLKAVVNGVMSLLGRLNDLNAHATC